MASKLLCGQEEKQTYSRLQWVGDLSSGGLSGLNFPCPSSITDRTMLECWPLLLVVPRQAAVVELFLSPPLAIQVEKIHLDRSPQSLFSFGKWLLKHATQGRKQCRLTEKTQLAPWLKIQETSGDIPLCHETHTNLHTNPQPLLEHYIADLNYFVLKEGHFHVLK